MRRWKRLLPCAVSMTMFLTPLCVYANETAEENKAEKQMRLEDNVIEYDELEDLILQYNPTIQNQNLAINSQIQDTVVLEKVFRDHMKDLNSQARELEAEGNPLAAQYRLSAKALKGTADGMKKQIESSRRVSNTMSMDQIKDTMISSAQGMMITYNQLISQREVLEKNKQLLAVVGESTATQASLGMATESAVLAAQKDLKALESSISKLDNSISQLRQNFCMMTGWAYDANPEIRLIPSSDLTKINAINLEEDKAKAIGNNYTLRKERGGKPSGSTGDRKRRKKTIEGSEQKLCTVMEELHGDILKKKVEYEAALSAFESASLTKAANDRKYQMGMISKLEYRKAEVDFAGKKSEKESADLALFQAFETYSWAVKGLAEIPQI